MLEGFEDITYPLTDEEKKLVPIFVKGFSGKYGKEQAVTSRTIIESLAKKNINVSGARVRKIVNHIRTGYLVPGLIATSSGYYISTDPEEVRNYIASLGHREAAIGSVRKKMEEYLQQIT